MDDDRTNDRTGSTDPGPSSTKGDVDETEREVITSGTAATSEVGDPAAQESARRRPGGAAESGEQEREERAPRA